MPEDKRYDEKQYKIEAPSGEKVEIVLRIEDDGVRRIAVCRGDEKDEYVSRRILAKLVKDQEAQNTTIEELLVAKNQELEDANAQISELATNLQNSLADRRQLQDRIAQYEAMQTSSSVTQTSTPAINTQTLTDLEQKVAGLEATLSQKKSDLDKHRSSVESACTSMIKDAEIINAAAVTKQEKVDAAYNAAVETLNSLKGYLRSISNKKDEIVKSVKDDLEYCRTFMENAKAAYAAEGAALILGVRYCSRLDLKQGELDIITGMDAVKTARLKARLIDAKSTSLMGYDDTLRTYFIQPITANTIKIAHFCLTGIPTEKGDMPTGHADSIRSTAMYLSDHLTRDYSILQLTEWEATVTKQYNLLEQQITALKL